MDMKVFENYLRNGIAKSDRDKANSIYKSVLKYNQLDSVYEFVRGKGCEVINVGRGNSLSKVVYVIDDTTSFTEEFLHDTNTKLGGANYNIFITNLNKTGYGELDWKIVQRELEIIDPEVKILISNRELKLDGLDVIKLDDIKKMQDLKENRESQEFNELKAKIWKVMQQTVKFLK